MPECTAWVSVRTSTSTRTRPRRLVVRAGTPMSQLPESAITMTSAFSAVLVLLEQLAAGCRAGDLLLALDEQPDGDGQVVAERTEGADVGHDPGLVVGGAAAVEAAVALGGLVRRGVPVGRVVLGLHVVVGVEQHGRRARGSLLLPHHGRRGAVEGAHDLDVDALGPEQLQRSARRSSPPRSSRSGSALTDWILTRSSRSARTDGRTACTRLRISSLMRSTPDDLGQRQVRRQVGPLAARPHRGGRLRRRPR